MSGARPSAGRPVLAFPCVPAPRVRAASQTGRAGAPRAPVSAPLAVPRSPPRRSPGWNEAGAPEEGAGGGRRDCSDPGAGGAEDAGAGARRRRGRGRGWGSGWQGAVHGSAHPVGAGADTSREESPRGGREVEGLQSSPPGSVELGGSSPSGPLPAQLGKTLFPPHPTRLELRQRGTQRPNAWEPQGKGGHRAPQWRCCGPGRRGRTERAERPSTPNLPELRPGRNRSGAGRTGSATQRRARSRARLCPPQAPRQRAAPQGVSTLPAWQGRLGLEADPTPVLAPQGRRAGAGSPLRDLRRNIALRRFSFLNAQPSPVASHQFINLLTSQGLPGFSSVTMA